MSAQPPNRELAALPDLFLPNEKNRAFVERRSQCIAVNPFIYLILLVMIPLTVISGIAVVTEWNTYREFMESGIATQATIIDRSTFSCGGQNDHTCYRLTYEFYARNDQRYAATGNVSAAVYEQSIVNITYIPRDPTMSVLTDQLDAQGLRLLHQGFLPLWCSLCAILVIWGLYRMHRLATAGYLLQGELIGFNPDTPHTISKIKFRFEVGLHFRFFNPSGREIEATKMVTRVGEPAWYKQTTHGTPLAVLYLNEKLYEVL